MKIYTRKGDDGSTSLLAGGRVAKSHPRVQAYGETDEANSIIGVVLALMNEKEKKIGPMLIALQNRLFDLGAELATAKPEALTKLSRLISADDIANLESEIDKMEAKLQPLKHFILPGGTPAAAQAHVARTVIRRAERHAQVVEGLRSEVLQFLNRTSDFLFVVSRYLNHLSGRSETIWRG